MLSERQLGKMVKYLGNQTVIFKKSKGFTDDSEALDYAISQIPTPFLADYEKAVRTCPTHGSESLREQVLKYVRNTEKRWERYAKQANRK